MLPVELQSVVDGMDTLGDQWTAYINRISGELFTYSEDEDLLFGADEDGENGSDWRAEIAAKAEEVQASEDFVELPNRFEIDEYSIMQRYCHGVADETIQDVLIKAIQGGGAFRRFKDAVNREGISEDWYSYRDAALRKIAADFLELEGIPYVDNNSKD